MEKVEKANYINSFIISEVVNYKSNKKNILAVIMIEVDISIEYDMGLRKITNSISGISYFGMDNFHDQYLIVCGKKHSIELKQLILCTAISIMGLVSLLLVGIE